MDADKKLAEEVCNKLWDKLNDDDYTMTIGWDLSPPPLGADIGREWRHLSAL